MQCSQCRGWLAVPAIEKWVHIDLSSPGVPGWKAVCDALTLPELRLFAEAAQTLGIDVTASSAEWTATCVLRRTDGRGSVISDEVTHSPIIVQRNGNWGLGGRDSQKIPTELPGSGWALAEEAGYWINRDTGFPLVTTNILDPSSDALRATGFSYFWEPDPEDGITVVIRECERLRGDIMDICASMSPAHSHPDIRLRAWAPLSPGQHLPSHSIAAPAIVRCHEPR